MNIDALLAELKPLADEGSLTAENVVQRVGGDAFLLMHATAGADARAREAMGTSDFERWSAVAIACNEATRVAVERTRSR